MTELAIDTDLHHRLTDLDERLRELGSVMVQSRGHT